MEEKGFIAEFKEFISRGNVMDMAVGIIIGGAFTAIITSLVNDIIMPLIATYTGQVSFTALFFQIGNTIIPYGNFIQNIVNFLLTALALFCVIKAINSLHHKEEPAPEPEPEPETPEDILLLREIRDSLKK